MNTSASISSLLPSGGPAAALDPIAASAPERPYVVAQLGQSLDGRIATPSGASKYINGPGALDFLHSVRASVDAVVVGIGTVIADDPMLTVRRVEGRSPARVIIDPNGRLPDGARCLADDGAAVYIVRPASNCHAPRGRTLEVAAEGRSFDPGAIVEAMAARGLRRILIEGGAETISRFLAARAVDRLYVLVAPMLLGSGRSCLQMPPIAGLDEALRPACRVFPLEGGDVLFDCCFQSTREITGRKRCRDEGGDAP